jgi:potassium-dependent mechanosensitive channel
MIAALIALAVAAAGLATHQADAQEPAAAPAATPEAAAPAATPGAAPAPEETLLSGDKQIAEFAASLDLWTKQIKLLAETIADNQTQDGELREVPGRLAELRAQIVEGRDRLKPKLDKLKDLLEELGPAPDETKPAESPQTALQRQKLSAAVVAVDGLLKRADVLLVATDQLTDAANEKRHERFTESLFTPVPGLFQHVLPGALDGVPFQTQSVLAALGAWLKLAFSKGALLVLLLLLIPVGAAVAANRFIKRIGIMRARRRGRSTAAEPTPQQRGTTAIWKALEICLPIWTGLAGFYLIAAAADLAEPTTAGIIARGCLAIAWASLLIAVINRSLAPNDAAARLVAIGDEAARRLALILRAMIVVWLIDQFWLLVDSAVFTPNQQTVLHAVVVAGLYVLLLGALLLQLRSGEVRRVSVNGWRTWLVSFCALLAGFIAVAVLLGYVELARFVGSHAISTAGLLWIMYLLHLVAESISSVSVISGRPIEGEAEPVEEDRGAPALLTIRIIGGLLMDIVIVVLGVTVLLVLWRFDWVEVKGWIQAAFFGFQLGEIRISLQTVFLALGVFALGLVVTRFVQRWFTRRAFSGRRTDQGLQDSARVGLGYVGFVLSAVAGLSYLGFSFSNLAIIAGALSVGIGFGLQSIFNNFVSGIILLVERPIKIGDWISVGNHEGMVKKISVRSTEIETIHRQSVIIPNANLITDPVTNWMHGNRTSRLDIQLGVSYDTDVRILRKILLDVGAAHGAVLKHPAPVVHFAGFGDSALDFELRVFLKDAAQRVNVASDLRFAMWAALNDAKISIPFPQRDIHIIKGAETLEPDGS